VRGPGSSWSRSDHRRAWVLGDWDKSIENRGLEFKTYDCDVGPEKVFPRAHTTILGLSLENEPDLHPWEIVV